MNILDYVYYHLFELTTGIRKFTARESALLYLSIIFFFLTSPFVMVLLIFQVIKVRLFFILLGLGYWMLIYFLLKKYFERKDKLNEIRQKFKDQNLFQKRIGYWVVTILFFSSFVLFFFFLSLL